ncbi:MAG: citrate synthase/methylcitrate synthase [Candidatus Thermoplasmatota archaeon]|nr:citrate synthase/methylcitrate synthase [Candidatus Thermoplasmatota archaeon]
MAEENVTISKGLEGIYIADTTLCKIDGQNGKLWYRGYPIEVLAEKSTYEEVAYLLLYGHLPTRRELDIFTQKLISERDVPEAVEGIIADFAGRMHPNDILRTCVSALPSFDTDMSDKSSDANLERAIKLTAKMPTIVAMIGRYKQGKSVVQPSTKLSHSANFLYMLTGKEPDKESSKLIDLMFILHAEHGSNASTFSTLVTGSTLADVYAAVVAGISTLRGPLHGGADEAALNMMRAIGEPDNTETYIEDALAGKQRIMGFGHRVYKAYDPRAKIVYNYLKSFMQKTTDPKIEKLLEIAIRAEKLMEEKLSKTKGIWPNIDFFAGPLYTAMEIPSDLFTPVFAASRVVGWTAHLFEYWQNNRLFRPLDHYVGQLDLKYVPIDQR